MDTPRKYTGTRSKAARKVAAALLPCACFRCGRMVTADMRWNADHPISRYDAESMGMPEHEQDRMVVPSHRSCDAKAGAELGNAIKKKGKAVAVRVPKVKRPTLDFFGDSDGSPAEAINFLSPSEVETPQEATGAP